MKRLYEVKKIMKNQEIISNTEISKLWRAFYASLLIEDIQLETRKPFMQFTYNYEDSNLCIESLPSNIIEYMNEEYGDKVEIFTENCIGEIYSLNELNELLAFKSLGIVKRIFNEKINKDNHEYALILPYKIDKVILLEGEEEKISLPSFSSFFFFHTHPIGDCFFSNNDWKSFIEFILNGGFVNGVLTNKCVFMIYRVYSLSEDDIIRLKDYVDKKEYMKNPFLTLKNNGKTIIKSVTVY